MSDTPPPIPVFVTPKGSKSAAGGLATISLISPLLVLGLGQALSFAGKSLSAPSLILAGLVLGVLSCVLLAAGLILGILALLLMKPGNRTTIVIRSLGGLALCSMLIGVAVPNFIKARARSLSQSSALKNVDAALADMRKQAVDSLTNQDQTPVNLDHVEQSFGQAADATTGDTAIVMKANQAYVHQLQSLQTGYSHAVTDLQSAHVLAVSNLVDHSSIPERRAVVQQFLKSNDELRDFASHSVAGFRAELVALKASPAVVETAAAKFDKSSAPQRPLVAEVRGFDDQIGEAMLGVLDLLDSNWGHWRYYKDTQKLRFEDQAVLDRYNAYLRDIKQASVDQVATQKRAATLVSSTSTP